MKNTSADQARNQKHKIELAKQYDKYREDYKNKLNPNDYPGNLSLIFELDTKVCLITTDDTTFVGELSSFDHFGNAVLSKAVSRYIDGDGTVMNSSFGHIFFRAEQILLIGKIDQKEEKKLIGADEDAAEE